MKTSPVDQTHGKKLALLLFALLFCLANVAHADIRFDRFGVRDGLSDNTISAIFQDSKGYMWFGTTNGLNRFDGYTYTHFKHDPEDSTSISDNYIRTIYESSNGCIWIGTLNGGLNRYNSRTGEFKAYKHDTHNTGSIAHNTVITITESSDGRIWTGTMGGVSVLDQKTGLFTTFVHEPDDLSSLNNTNIGKVFIDSHGNLWVGTNFGLNHIDTATNVITRIEDKDPAHASLSQNIIDICEDKNGYLWLSCWGGGLRKYDPETGIFEVFLHDPKDPSTIRSNIVGHSAIDDNGILWFGSPQGFHSLDTTSNEINYYLHDPSNQYSISSNSIWAVYHDRSDILWVGTLYSGGNKVVPSKSIFSIFKLSDIYDSATSGGFVDKFIEIGDDLWFGSNFGIHKYNQLTGQFSTILFSEFDKQGIDLTLLRKFYYDNKGHLWLGTSLTGLVRFDLATKNYQKFGPELLTPPKSFLEISTINKDSDGLLWIGTNQGMMLFDPESESYRNFDVDPKINSQIVNASEVSFDPDGRRVWIVGQFGLVVYDKKEKSVQFIFSSFPGSRSLTSNYIFDILDDGAGRLWFGTNDGFYSYGKENGELLRHKLANDSTHALAMDHNQKIWISTSAGISRIDPESGTVYNFDVGDGIPIFINVNQALFCAHNGILYIGGNNGFYTFSPDDIFREKKPPRVAVSAVKSNNADIDTEGDITELRSIALPYGKGSLTLEFVALDFANPENNVYSYRMDGIHEDWISAGNERRVTFSNLEPGHYVFRFKAANNQGTWKSREGSLDIVIISPFYKTVWFKVLIAALVIIIVILVFRIQHHTIIVRNRRLEQRVAERTKELQETNSELVKEIEVRKQAESKIKVLGGLIPICASCKKIRDDDGYWRQIESYISEHSDADFSHGICPDCMKKFYPDIYAKQKKSESRK